MQRTGFMSEEADALKARTQQFALAVLHFARKLPTTDECRDIASQLRRAGTAVGANYRSTCRARSRSEFISRVNCALEEADESAFWLEILAAMKIAPGIDVEALLDEANQLCAIFVASSITATEAERSGDPDPHHRRRRGP